MCHPSSISSTPTPSSRHRICTMFSYLQEQQRSFSLECGGQAGGNTPGGGNAHPVSTTGRTARIFSTISSFRCWVSADANSSGHTSLAACKWGGVAVQISDQMRPARTVPQPKHLPSRPKATTPHMNRTPRHQSPGPTAAWTRWQPAGSSRAPCECEAGVQ